MLVNESHPNKNFIVNMKYWMKCLYILCIWSAQIFIKAETKSINDCISEEVYAYDYTHIETQLERLSLQMKINHETQRDQQNKLFNKINDLSLQIKGIEAKLLEKHETEEQVSIVTPPPVDDKILVMTEIREKLKEHDNILAQILNNRNDCQEVCEKNDLKNHTQTLENTISDKLIALQNIDGKIASVENISMEIVNNQKNIQNLLQEMSWENHTQTLWSTIAEKLDLMQEIDEKLRNIGNNLIPKTDQLQFYQDIQQSLNTTEIYHKSGPPNSNYESYPTYCSDNKRLIKNHVYGPEPFLVPCHEDGGAWIVIQRRINGSVDFYRGWSEYKIGFGNIDGEFFIGLDKLHALTSTLMPVELLIILQDFDNEIKYAKYDNFQIGNESDNYNLITVGTYTGNAGDSLSQHVSHNFTTKDRDNDIYFENCAVLKTGAWWYNECINSNLNGKYYNDPSKLYDAPSHKRGINWGTFRGFQYSLKFVQMMIRPRKF